MHCTPGAHWLQLGLLLAQFDGAHDCPETICVAQTLPVPQYWPLPQSVSVRQATHALVVASQSEVAPVHCVWLVLVH